MDALAVNVVTPERVGMATEIFNTMRVSADGVAIAIISALLAAISILSDHGALLLQHYADSFAIVMYVLAGIAAMTACAVFVLLRE